jgi:hypothetical protein
METTELVRVLRAKAKGEPADAQGWKWGDWICKEAADTLERQRILLEKVCPYLEMMNLSSAHKLHIVIREELNSETRTTSPTK